MIGCSAGGLKPLIDLLSRLPQSLGLPILVVQHLSMRFASRLPEILGWTTQRLAKWAEDGEQMRPGVVYVAPVDRHLTVASDRSLCLSASPRVNLFRPAADPLFESAARVFAGRAVAIVLSGMLDDGARGTAAVRRSGGLTFAQTEASADFFDMPAAAIDFGKADIVLSPARMAVALSTLAAAAA